MEARGLIESDLVFLAELPALLGSEAVADKVVAAALLASESDEPFRRQVFFGALGWGVANHPQALWAFDKITLQEAEDRAQALSEHLMAAPLFTSE